jgi:Flp pilus assembly protein TadG
MQIKKYKLCSDENGNGVLLYFLFFFIFIGTAGLVIDMGILYKTKAELRKTANAAVLSGAQELKNTDASINTVISDILKAAGEESSLKNIAIRPNNENKLAVTLERSVTMSFMKLFYINSIPVSVTSTAGIAPLSRAAGAVPLGIDKNITLEYMKEYTLKVDAGASSYGNFGILALSGVGANLYEQDLMYGYDTELKIGDIIETQTGNIEGKTRDGVNYRINLSPYQTDDYSHRDDPRVILILVYEPDVISFNQLKSVKICGFAYFYLKQPMSVQDSSITGYFIQRVGTGTGNINTKDNGAYAIRLVE